MSGVGRDAERLLRLEASWGKSPRRGKPSAGRRPPKALPLSQRSLRGAAPDPGSVGRRLAGESPTGGEAAADVGSSGQGGAEVQGHHPVEAWLAHGPEPAGTGLHRRRAKPGVAGGYYLRRNRRGLALPRGGTGGLFPRGDGLGHGGADNPRSGHRGPHHGGLAAPSRAGVDRPFRPGQPVRLRGLPGRLGTPWLPVQHESKRQLLRQRRHGKLLPFPEGRAGPRPPLSHQGRGQGRHLRVYRDLLQPDPAALDLGLPVTQGFRESEGRLMNRVSTRRWQDHTSQISRLELRKPLVIKQQLS